ncbi:MAG TPA: hypothetical protein VGN96_15830 [Roseococcus sp.]|nr:hypothetical protein [Roseococcus sp.]
MQHRAYRWPTEGEAVAALAGLSPLALDVIGVAYDEEGLALPGWHVNAAWVEAPESLVGAEIAPATAPRWWAGVPVAPPGPDPVTTEQVDAERDRRIDAGMEFQGVRYQTRPQDRENVAGASIMALAAMVQGAQPGDYRWHGGEADFVWIGEDNSLTPFDAMTFFGFGQAMAAHKSAHIFAARALKDSVPIPLDYASDAYWP